MFANRTTEAPFASYMGRTREPLYVYSTSKNSCLAGTEDAAVTNKIEPKRVTMSSMSRKKICRSRENDTKFTTSFEATDSRSAPFQKVRFDINILRTTNFRSREYFEGTLSKSAPFHS